MKLAKMGQFVVEQEACVAGGRIGNFKFKSTEDAVSYRTPLFFIHTLSGSVPHITREVFDIIFPPASKTLPPPIQVSIDSTFTFCEAVGPSNRDISSFVGLDHCPCILTVHNPSKELKSGFNDTKGISIWSRVGRKTLTDTKFSEIISDFKPSLFQALSDYDVSSLSSHKRFSKSTSRTLSSLDACVKSNENKPPLLFTTVETAWFTINEREANRVLGQMLENSNHITGFVLNGISLPLAAVEIKNKAKHNVISEKTEKIEIIASPPINRTEVLSKVIPKLPLDKPRYVPGPLNPEEIIDLVEMGIDMFDSSIITRMADNGDVFLFNLDEYAPDEKNASLNFNEGLAGADAPKQFPDAVSVSSVLRLKDKKYFDDFSPISSKCDCYTCRKHTKAYINHLYTVNELLGPVLVMAHNLVSFNRFFEAIRHCIQKDSENDIKDMLNKLKMNVKNETSSEASGDAITPDCKTIIPVKL